MSVGSFPASGGGGGSGSVTSVAFSTGTTGLSVTGSPITTSGTITLAGTLVVANGGTGATDAAGARVNLGSTTVGDSFFTLTNPSAITFPRINADNTVSALDAATFRSAIGAGTGSGSVTSVDLSGGTTGLTTSGGPVTGSGTITLAGTLGAANGGTGSTTLAANNVLLGNGTSALQVVAPGASGNVLTSNGTTWTSAAPASPTITGWTAALATTTPNDVTYAASFTATGSATDIDAVIAPKGAGAITARIPDSGTTGGNKRGINAVDFQVTRSANTQVASGSNSAIIGGSNGTASGQAAVILGGTSNSATGQFNVVVGGQSNTTSGNNCVVIGGSNNTANSVAATTVGGRQGTVRSISANVVQSSSIPISNTSGVSQVGRVVLGRATTDATPTVLASDASAASTTNQVILPNNSAYIFEGKIIANVTGGGNTSGWTFTGVIKRGANAASTALVAAVTPTLVAQDAGASTWAVAVAADTTNGGLKVTVTGQAATTIRWVCHIETTEVTF